MKTKLFSFLLALVASVGTMQARSMESSATTNGDLLQIELLSDADEQYAVSLIGQLRFDNDEMFLIDKSGVELGSTPVMQIGKIVFPDQTDSPNSVSDVPISSVRVYPNPAMEKLIINGVQQSQIVRIYNLQGQQMSATLANGERAEIYVGNLQHGTYLLQIGAEVIKIIKQ